jgi:hypothetical protein
MINTNGYTNRWPRAKRALRRGRAPFALALATMLLSAISTARAGVSYQIYMSSDFKLLMDPMNMSTQSMVQQTASTAANTANNNPVIDIKNTSMTASIKEVQFMLTDPDSVFDALGILQGPSDAQKRFGTTGPFATMTWGGSSKTIDIVLPTPLAPQHNLVFFVNLAPLNGHPDSTWMPGYTNIFFQDPPGPNPNANLKVFFNDNTILDNPLPSLESMATNTSTDPAAFVLASSCCNAPPTMFLTGGFGGSPVPEPSSVLLVMLGSLPLAIPAWRRYRRARR